MRKELLCIVCPTGCRLTAEYDEGGSITVTGNGCARGVAFAKDEITCPTRSLTTTARTIFPDAPVLPVRTAGDIPKERIADAMKAINSIVIQERVGVGDVVIKNLLGSGVDVIATGDILQETQPSSSNQQERG